MNFKAHEPEKNYPGMLISTGMNTPTKNLAVQEKTNCFLKEKNAFELEKVDLKYNIKGSRYRLFLSET